MLSLQPQEQFVIVRQLSDHTDTTTYYVQAVVRKSIDDTILRTVNLTNTGSNRFKSTYEVPADISGAGMYIDITTSVYLDSEYTIKAVAYGDEGESYLVFDRIVRFGGGGGGGVDIDYKKIQKMIDKVSIKLPEPIEQKEVDFSQVLNSLDALKKELLTQEKPEPPEKPEKVDLVPVLKSIQESQRAILDAIDSKPVTESTDLSKVILAVKEKERNTDDAIKVINSITGALNSFIKEMKAGSENESEDPKDELKTKTQKLLGNITKVDSKVSRLM